MIDNDPIKKIQGPSSIQPSIEEKSKEDEKSATVDSGLSTIEKSKSVTPEMPMTNPILAAPLNMDAVAFAVASVDSSGRPITETVSSFVLKGEDIKDSVLKGWMANLKEIEEFVRQLLSSPNYMQLQEIRQKGDPLTGQVSGVQGALSAVAAANQTDQVTYLSSLNRSQVLERVPGSAEVPEPSAPQDSTQALILPLAAALLAGGGVIIGSQVANASNPIGSIVDLVQQLQPIIPNVSIQDMIPVINLMIVAPIYYHSWNEAVSNLKSGQRHNHVQTAQNFAKDVIKIVADPHFVTHTLISRMPGTEKLSPEDQERLSRMLKIVLIGVALSLLYSVEVGKVQNGKFGGMTAEEFLALIKGTWTKPAVPGQKMDSPEALTESLIKRIHEQLATLSIGDRTLAANMLLDYITQTRDLNPMLEPVKVFEEVLASSEFHPTTKGEMLKA